MDEVGTFYSAEDESSGTHLALRWNGRMRFTVPRNTAAQAACWKLFRPGGLGVPLRAMTRLPRLLGAVTCVEAGPLLSIRKAIGKEGGLSCCRAGAEGVWSKDTILFLDKTAKPLYIVKAGTGASVDHLLQNEAHWLRNLRDHASLVNNIPELILHRSGTDLCFVAQRVTPGKLHFRLGALQFEFLRRLREYSAQPMLFEDSKLQETLTSRVKGLSMLVSEEWSIRLERSMRRINENLCGTQILLSAAHNDFTPWNIRIQNSRAYVFDWEYAAYEQLPMFDPLHFALLPAALRRRPKAEMVKKMYEAVRICRLWLGTEFCYYAQIQTLAYLMNICTLYLSSVQGNYVSHPVLDSYAYIIDRLSL